MMLAICFIVFFALVLAWLAAPNADSKAAPTVVEAAPRLTTSEAAA